MKKVALALIVVSLFSTTTMAVEIAISTQAGWYSQAAADREMAVVVANVTAVPVEVFTASDQAALANWVIAHTGDGVSDLLILNGQFPNTIYAPGNTQADGSLAELFLDDGNCIINTGDYMFYVVDGAGTNAEPGLETMMDLAHVEMWDDDTPVTVTADGQKYTPSLQNYATDRPWHFAELTGDWYAELILAQDAAGARGEPVIVRNAVTGGRLGTFYQTASQDNDPRGKVISEWINNWYLPNVAVAKNASNPIPIDGSTDIPRDVILKWMAGQYAATHDVYVGTASEDVDAADRANPGSVLVSQGQADAQYGAEAPLEYGQTYYWRVDEVNAAPDNTIFKGDVWSFTAEPYGYPITNVTATASGSPVNMGPENTVNGSGLNALDQHSTTETQMWMSSGTMPAWIQFEFDKVYKLNDLLVWNSNQLVEAFLGFGAKDVTIEYSEDGATWATLEGVPQFAQATASPTYTANTTVEFGGVMAKFVKLTISSNWGGMAPQTGLSEVRFSYVPVQAFNPEPADGAADVSVETEFNWRPGREATSHVVYLGTDSAAVADGTAPSETVTAHGYAPTDLLYGTQYSWKVDEVGDAGTYAGDVWSFTTEQYAVVDDFESYTNNVDAETTIWHAWIDGLTDGASGSQVGYDQAPFAERNIVHGGTQSMPLKYDNASFAFSEATRTFEEAQDWTARGLKTLSLFFSGRVDNDGQLYVKIGSKKVVYDGDASDLARVGWQTWNIDLSAVGNVSSVRSLTIGVEGAGASGMLFIDDIRLSPKAAASVTPVEPDPANLVGYYKLDEGSGTKAGDSSGKGHDGTVNGDPQWVAGMVGGALEVGGDGDFVDLGNPADWPAGAEARSMCAWLRTEDLTATWHFAVAYGSANTYQAMFIGLNGTALYGGGYGDDVSLANFWTTGVWHHIALTYDGATARLYADGVEVAAAAKSWNLVRSRARLGQQVNDLNEFWQGGIDDVRIYNKALSPAEVAFLAGRQLPIYTPL